MTKAHNIICNMSIFKYNNAQEWYEAFAKLTDVEFEEFSKEKPYD